MSARQRFCHLDFRLGFGTVSYFIGTEFCDIEYRSTVFSVCYSLNNILIVLTNMQAMWAFRRFGPFAFVPLFVVPCCAALAYLYVRLPDTRHRRIADIVEELRSDDCGRRARRVRGLTAINEPAKVAPVIIEVFAHFDQLDVSSLHVPGSVDKPNPEPLAIDSVMEDIAEEQ